jgi:hypothetical protein
MSLARPTSPRASVMVLPFSADNSAAIASTRSSTSAAARIRMS